MSSTRLIGRAAVGLGGAALVSPLGLWLWHPEGWPLHALLAGRGLLAAISSILVVELVGIALLGWSSYSISALAALGLAAPLLTSLGTEGAPWAVLFLLGKLPAQAATGWYGWKRNPASKLRWPGALLPTIVLAGLAGYALLV